MSNESRIVLVNGVPLLSCTYYRCNERKCAAINVVVYRPQIIIFRRVKATVVWNILQFVRKHSAFGREYGYSKSSSGRSGASGWGWGGGWVDNGWLDYVAVCQKFMNVSGKNGSELLKSHQAEDLPWSSFSKKVSQILPSPPLLSNIFCCKISIVCLVNF